MTRDTLTMCGVLVTALVLFGKSIELLEGDKMEEDMSLLSMEGNFLQVTGAHLLEFGYSMEIVENVLSFTLNLATTHEVLGSSSFNRVENGSIVISTTGLIDGKYDGFTVPIKKANEIVSESDGPNLQSLQEMIATVDTALLDNEKNKDSRVGNINRKGPATTSTPEAERFTFPIESKGLILNENNFSFKGARYEYTDIVSIMFSYESTSVNFVSFTYIHIHLKLTTGNKIKFKIKKGLFNKIQFEAAYQAYQALKSFSFESRVDKYLAQLNNTGFIEYKYPSGNLGMPSVVKIHKDGTVEKGNKRVDLKIANDRGILQFGTSLEGFTGMNSSKKPNEIAMSENRNARYATALRINATWDNDVITPIIKSLSEGKRLV